MSQEEGNCQPRDEYVDDKEQPRNWSEIFNQFRYNPSRVRSYDNKVEYVSLNPELEELALKQSIMRKRRVVTIKTYEGK